MSGCPTCGGWQRTVVRVRRGGRARLKRGTPWPWWKYRDERRGGSSVRVYWPRTIGWGRPTAACPDAWHQQFQQKPGRKAERSTTVNLHASRDDANGRRRHRAAQHRERQSKDKR